MGQMNFDVNHLKVLELSDEVLNLGLLLYKCYHM